MDSRVGGIRASLRGAGTRSKYSGEPAAECIGSLALRALRGSLFSRSTALLPAEALENSRAGCGPTLRTVDRSQRHRRDFRFRGHSRFFAVHRGGGGVLAGKPAAGNARRPAPGRFLRFLGSAVDRAHILNATPELQGAGMSV